MLTLAAQYGNVDSFWAMVGIAAAVSTALATGVSTSLALYWRWRDRSEAEWAAMNCSSTWVVNSPHGNNREPQASANLTNVGDGTAYKITIDAAGVEGIYLTERERRQGFPISVEQPIPAMRTGDAVHVTVLCDPEGWDDALVTVSWWHAPTQKRKRFGLWSLQKHQRFPLSEIAAVPVVSDQGKKKDR